MDVTVEVPANVARDADNHGNQAAEPFSIQARLVGLAVSYGAASYTATEGGDDATVTVSLSPAADREVRIPITTDPATGDFNLPVREVVFASGEQTKEITVEAADDADLDDETVKLGFGTLPAGVSAGTQSTTTVTLKDDDKDQTRPTVEIQTQASAPVTGPFEVTIRFSEPVDGFALVDIQVTNGRASNFTQISKRQYRATITPEASGEVTVEVGSNVAQDAGGNNNRGAEPLVIRADLERPGVEITSEATGPVSGEFEVTVTFSEAVTRFEQNEITVTNGSVTAFSGSGTTYTAEITPAENGQVKVEIGENVAQDGSGNGNQAAEPFTIQADLKPPEVTIEGPTEPVGMEGFEVKITFSEPVEGFELEDIQVSNGTAEDFTEVSPSEYQATIKPAVAGQPVVVEVPEDVAQDGAGNPNRAAEPLQVKMKVVVSFEAKTYTATEGGEAVTVTVKLSRAADAETKIPIRVTRPEATEADDYTVQGLEDWEAEKGVGSLTLAPGETEGSFQVQANHDGDGEDEELELGFGELPDVLMAGELAVATVTLKDKGLVELEVSFGQAEYQVMEGQQANIEVKVSPSADRRVEVPLVVALEGGATSEDYSGVPASLVFEEGEDQGTISVNVLADEVNDPGEAIVLSFGELPEAVSPGDPSTTKVHFNQQRTAEQFSRTLEAILAVVARSMAESAQTAIEGRFERHRQWSRLESSAQAMQPLAPGVGETAPGAGLLPSSHGSAGLAPGESMGLGSAGIDGSSSRRQEDPMKPSAWGPAQSRPAAGSSRDSGSRQTGTPGSWLRSFSPGGLASMACSGQMRSGFSGGYSVGSNGRDCGPDGLGGSGTGDSSLRPGSTGFSRTRNHELNLAGTSFEMSLGGQNQKGQGKSWGPVLWGHGDLQYFNGNLSRIGMNYRGGLNAAHVGLDLYANDKVLAGLSFMRSWGNMDYTDDGVDGVLDSGLNTFHPYLYWQPHRRFSAWVIGGLGRGGVEVNEPGRSHDFKADFRMLSGGMRSVVSKRGNTELGVVLDSFTASLGTDALEDIAKVRGNARRTRMMLELTHDKALSAGKSLSVKVEVGGRHDEGDADRGTGVESGFRLGYLDANSGLDVALLGRTLVAHESDYQDWGVGVQASWDPGEKQRGFRVSVTSSRGQDGQGRTDVAVEQLECHHASDGDGSDGHRLPEPNGKRGGLRHELVRWAGSHDPL